MTWFSALTGLGKATSRAVLGTPPPPARFPHALRRNPFAARPIEVVIAFPGNIAVIAHIGSTGTAIMSDAPMHWSSGHWEWADTKCRGRGHRHGCTSLTSSMYLRHGRPPWRTEMRSKIGLVHGRVMERTALARTVLEA